MYLGWINLGSATEDPHLQPPYDEEEVIEQELLKEKREGGEYIEEVDSSVPSLQNSTDSDRYTEEEDSPECSPWNSADSDRQTEEEETLSDKPTGEPTDGPTNETAVKLTERHSPDDELTEECKVLFACLLCINVLRDIGECCESVPLDRTGSYISISINITKNTCSCCTS